MALRLYPMNSEALLAAAEKALAGTVTEPQLVRIRETATRALSHDPGDGRLHSLLGEVERRLSSTDAADREFNRALSIAPTEIHALQWTLVQAATQGDAGRLLALLDRLFRRWPDRIAEYAPLVPGLFAAPADRERLVSMLESSPPWQSTLISRLCDDAATLPFAAELIEELAAGPTPPRDGDISNVLNGLINAGLYKRARQTFLLTLTPEQLAVTGHVHDGRFALRPTGRPFDWQIRGHPGVVFSVGDGSPADGSGLALTFQNAPVRDLRVRQFVSLSPGGYSLGIRASGIAARLPKGLFWSIRCGVSNKLLGQIAVPDGGFSDVGLSTRFEVPAESCGMQVLDLSTKAIAESWNDRYAGTVTFSSVTIEDLRP